MAPTFIYGPTLPPNLGASGHCCAMVQQLQAGQQEATENISS